MSDPILPAAPCPYAVMPSSVKSAVKAASENGWSSTVSFAIGPEPEEVQSVVFRASRGKTRLVSRHEAKVNATVFSFKAAWTNGPDGIPLRIGWRDLTTALKS